MPENHSLTMGFEGRQVDVAWQTEDLSGLIAKYLLSEHTGRVLAECGVFFHPSGVISISEQMPTGLQPHAALHETLCMLERVGPSCSDIEARVAQNIPEETLRWAYLFDRERMFSALVDEYPETSQFDDTWLTIRDILESMTPPSQETNP